ncbi:MAG: VWA domain-containing protein [Victivallales bacterium]|nr:VWA domain-containing protein [Victivallales bacterium]
MKLTQYMLASLALSLLLHIVLLGTLSNMTFETPFPRTTRDTPRALLPLTLRPVPRPEVRPKPAKLNEHPNRGGELNDLLFSPAESERKLTELFKQEKIAPQPPEPTIRFSGLEKASLKPTLPAKNEEPVLSAPRPKILEIDASKLPPERIGPRVLTPKIERTARPELHLPSLLPVGPSMPDLASAPPIEVGLRFTRPKYQPPRAIPDDIEVSPFTPPSEVANIAGNNSLGGTDHPHRPDKNSGLIPSVPLDDFVSIDVIVQDDPATGGGFFKATIHANDRSEAIHDIAKDTLFILDRSTSISSSKFQEFKVATIQALEYLNPRDRFNIVSFSEKPYAFSRQYIAATPANLEAARKYVKSLTRGGMTDVFGGLHPFVNSGANDLTRPLNIFLLTDGISTVNIYQDDDFLRRITGNNPGNVSIFPFSAGKEANRELLDFLGFLNRGYRAHADNLTETRKYLSRFINDLSSLLVMDMAYIAEGSIAREMYPKKIPHLYRNSPLRLYGRFGPGEKKLLLTIRGTDAAGKRRDLVFQRNLDEAPRSQDDLGRQWASQKILHLLADRTLTQSTVRRASLQREIRALGTAFSIAVPY